MAIALPRCMAVADMDSPGQHDKVFESGSRHMLQARLLQEPVFQLRLDGFVVPISDAFAHIRRIRKEVRAHLERAHKLFGHVTSRPPTGPYSLKLSRKGRSSGMVVVRECGSHLNPLSGKLPSTGSVWQTCCA